MCNSPGILILIFIVKIIIFISLPICVIINRKKSFIKLLLEINIVSLLLIIVLSLLNNSYIVNSNIRGIKNALNNRKYSNTAIYVSNDANIVEKIKTDKIYKNSLNQNVYYYNHNDLPISDKAIVCGGKKLYMKQYGNNITAVSIIVSSLLNENIDPYEILNIALANNILDCNIGFDTEKLLDVVSLKYNLRRFDLTPLTLESYVNSGGLVLTEVGNDFYAKNISCNKAYIVVYNINKENEFSILNPNDTTYDYICPSNSLNYGQVIKASSNEKLYNITELNSFSSRYIAIERN